LIQGRSDIDLSVLFDVIPEIEDNINTLIKDKNISLNTYRVSESSEYHINKKDYIKQITY
jgi:protein subunit release factor A